MAAAAEAALPAFPGALGWAAQTPGGRGGRIIRVTTLDSEGPGSLREAIEADGPRIVVFEVGGVIDLNRKTLKIANPFITIAGQTAPSPGVTLIRGGIDIGGHDVIIQHIRVRPGSAEQGWMSGWDEDSISTQAAWNVISSITAVWNGARTRTCPPRDPASPARRPRSGGRAPATTSPSRTI